jgi:hypothetical protein
MSEIRMALDRRDVWPDDVPVGTFDIEEARLKGRPVTARIMFVCPAGKRCGVFLGPAFQAKPSDGDPNVWGWDGNDERPTLTPSINCVGGCGWHGFITAGVMR